MEGYSLHPGSNAKVLQKIMADHGCGMLNTTAYLLRSHSTVSHHGIARGSSASSPVHTPAAAPHSGHNDPAASPARS